MNDIHIGTVNHHYAEGERDPALPSHASVVIIGGGVVGCSILFHLAKFGWKDVVLLERDELTSGSSWHAAGGFHTISSDSNISRLQAYTIKLYEEIEALSGQSVGLHATGGFYLAATAERLDYLKRERSKARNMGLEQEFITPDEIKAMHPLIDSTRYLGALYDPLEGHVDPAGATWAYAKAAKSFGASYLRHTPVVETVQRRDLGWDVVTPKGTIHADIIVNAGGLWAREIGQLAGLELPVQPMEHHYLVTESIPEIAAAKRWLPGGVDYEANLYFRQEHQGLLLGTYETNATPWKVEGTPQDFAHELLPDALDRIAERLDLAFERIPVLNEAGIKNVVNGPFTFGPDGNPLIGPMPGMQNYWVAIGVMAGFSQAGGVGLAMAEWMIDGEPSMDISAMDIARFGDFATAEYGTQKASENYARRFLLTYPNETLPAMRRLKTTSLYDRLVARGAVMGDSFGLEQALWFAGSPEAASETPTFRRSNAHEPVAQECQAVREAVGLIEIAGFAQHEFQGPGARAFLDWICAGRIPKAGRLALTPLLTPKGRLCGDLTVACLDETRFLLFGSGVAQVMHQRWFEQHLPAEGVTYRNASDAYQGLALSGPQSRTLLSRITRLDVSAEALPFRAVRETVVGGVRVLLCRVSFSGELGYELYCAPQSQLRLFEAIEAAGQDLGLKLYGLRALMSLRLEKSWGVWGLDYTADYSAAEAGLDAFIDWKKAFIGKEAALIEREQGPARRLVTLVVDARDADVTADEAVFHAGLCVGAVTSGGYAQTCGQSVALAYIPSELVKDGAAFEVEILGERRPATLTLEPLYDPEGKQIRS